MSAPPARSGIASLEVIQEKYNIRTQALVLAALGAVTFIFSVATTALVAQAFLGTYIPGDYVWLTILSILTVIIYGIFIWRDGDGARSTEFAPGVRYLGILIVYAIMWFGAAIGPVAVTGYTEGVVLYCSQFTRIYAACAIADVTEALAWIIFALHIVAILAVVGQGQKYSTFKSGAGIPLNNVPFVGVQTTTYTPPPPAFTPPPNGYTGMYNPQIGGTPPTPMGVAGTPPPQFPQYDNNAYPPPTPSQGYSTLPTQGYTPQTPSQGYSTLPPPPQAYTSTPPPQGYTSPTLSQEYAATPQGYAPPTPSQEYAATPQGYAPPTPSQEYATPPQRYATPPPPQGYGANTYSQPPQEYPHNVYIPPQSPNIHNQIPAQNLNAYTSVPAQPPNAYNGVLAQTPNAYISAPAQTPNAYTSDPVQPPNAYTGVLAQPPNAFEDSEAQ